MTDVNVAVIHYSATGSVFTMAEAAAKAAEAAGAEVRLRKVRELAPDEAIRSNGAWAAHRERTSTLPEATLDDLEWADVLMFGTPTRFGLPSAQLKQFIDGAGGLWGAGKLIDKVGTSFTSAATAHGGHETTLTGPPHPGTSSYRLSASRQRGRCRSHGHSRPDAPPPDPTGRGSQVGRCGHRRHRGARRHSITGSPG